MLGSGILLCYLAATLKQLWHCKNYMTDHILNILVLCTGNSCRSILAEAMLNELGKNRIQAFSAGSNPTGTPNPNAISLLKRQRIDTEFARSKSWDEFTAENSPPLDLIITVCDNAANETCPIWNGAPITVHWGIPDPADVVEPQEAVTAAFQKTWQQLEQRITRFLNLPLETMRPQELQEAMDKIGAECQ